MNIGDLFFSLRANDARLQAEVKKAGDKAGQSLGKEMSNSFRTQFSGANLGKGIVQGLGLAGGLGIANIASEVADFIGDSIEAASALNETMTKSQVVFGDSADEVEEWAETMDTSFGQSKRAALDVASTFAGLFQTVGIAEDEAAEKARKLTELGSDLASFFNTDVQTAVESLRSGLAGESEPLRKFNVFLSETAVSAKLVEMGQRKVNGQWTEAQKIAGRYAIILEQTVDAQGDFARTSDGLANQQRILNAELENAQALLGQELIPVQLKVTEVMRDAIPVLLDLLGALKFVIDGWAALNENLHLISDPRDRDKGLNRTTHNLKKLGESAYGAAGAADQIGVDARDARKAIGGMGEASEDATDAAEDLEEALDDLTDAAYDAAGAFGDQLYSVQELKGRIADLTTELYEAKAALQELEAIKNPTAAQQRDIEAARGKVAGLRHDLFDTRLELAKLDKAQLDALLLELSRVQYRTDAVGDEAREALTLFQKLAFAAKNVPGYAGGDPGYAPRASGGPVYSGHPYLVGEQGPELMVPNMSGTILPNAMLSSGIGGGNVQNNYVTVEGLIPYRDPLSIPQALQRFGESGLLDFGVME